MHLQTKRTIRPFTKHCSIHFRTYLVIKYTSNYRTPSRTSCTNPCVICTTSGKRSTVRVQSIFVGLRRLFPSVHEGIPLEHAARITFSSRTILHGDREPSCKPLLTVPLVSGPSSMTSLIVRGFFTREKIQTLRLSVLATFLLSRQAIYAFTRPSDTTRKTQAGNSGKHREQYPR